MQMQDYGGYGQPPPGDYGHTSPMPPMPPPPPRRRVGLLSYVAVALVAGALGAGTVVALYHPAASTATPSARPSAPPPPPSTAVPMPSNGGAPAPRRRPPPGRGGARHPQTPRPSTTRAGP